MNIFRSSVVLVLLHEYLYKTDDEMALRLNLVKKVCERHATVLRRKELFKPEAFIIDTKDKFTMCLLGKVASSTWLEHFRILAANPKLDAVITPASRYYLVKNYFSYKRLNDVDANLVQTSHGLNVFNSRNGHLTFAAVRHPYFRLVSAFESKFLKTDDHHFEAKRSAIGHNFTAFIDFVVNELDQCPVGIGGQGFRGGLGWASRGNLSKGGNNTPYPLAHLCPLVKLRKKAIIAP